jgi:gliding motility-associated lipoprotein GldD
MRILVLVMSSIVLLGSCNSGYQPKPKSYFAIEVPKQRTYTPFIDAAYPYTFEFPTDAKLIKDSTFFEPSPKNDYWINVDYPKHKCKIYLSYNRINGNAVYKRKDASGKYIDSLSPTSFDKLREDAFNLTAKHIYKSSDIPNELIKTPKGIGGILFKVGGDAASPIQFFLTDTTTHFLRGSLYYDAQPNADSTRPITEYIFKDLQHLINTLEWRGK